MILITQPRAGHSHNEILALQFAARQFDWDVLSAPGGWRMEEELINSKVKGVPYGSQTFCEVIAQQMGWSLKANPFDWLSKVPQKYLKRQVDFMTLGEAKKLTQTKFIKPADDKVFQASVYTPGTLVTHEAIPDDTPSLVSDVVEFDLEYRCFVDNEGHIATWSNYVCYDHIAEPRYYDMVPMSGQTPMDFLNDYLDEVCLAGNGPVPSVIDVGRIKGKGWAIIETNQAWASGLYGCEPMDALRVMKEACDML